MLQIFFLQLPKLRSYIYKYLLKVISKLNLLSQSYFAWANIKFCFYSVAQEYIVAPISTVDNVHTNQ